MRLLILLLLISCTHVAHKTTCDESTANNLDVVAIDNDLCNIINVTIQSTLCVDGTLYHYIDALKVNYGKPTCQKVWVRDRDVILVEKHKEKT